MITAAISGLSCTIYVTLMYMPTGHIHIRDWFNSTDKIICTIILSIFLIKVYVSQHRQNEIFSYEGATSLLVALPIIAIPNNLMNMMSEYYLLIAISRFLRIAYFCIVLQNYLNLGEGEIGSKLKLIVMTMMLIILIFSGIFIETENWYNIERIVYGDEEKQTNLGPGYYYNDEYLKQPNTPLQFHHGLYYVIVTIFTVGYGDINAMNIYSQLCTIVLMVVTVAIIPK